MNRIRIETKEDFEQAVLEAKKVLESGGLIIYPTDTLYGIGVDAQNTAAIKKVFELKGRDFDKPISVIISDIITAEKYAEISQLACQIAAKVLPGAVTLILPKKDCIPDVLVGGEKGLGIRVPDSYFSLELAKQFGRPYTTTSANAAGEVVDQNVDAILESFKGKEQLIDLVIDVGTLPKRNASTILKIEGDRVEVIREGDVNMQGMQLVTREGEE